MHGLLPCLRSVGKPTAVVKRNRLVKRSRQFQWRDPVHEHLEVEGNIMLSDIAVSHGRVHTDSGRNLRIYEAHLAKGGTLSKRQAAALCNGIVCERLL